MPLKTIYQGGTTHVLYNDSHKFVQKTGPKKSWAFKTYLADRSLPSEISQHGVLPTMPAAQQPNGFAARKPRNCTYPQWPPSLAEIKPTPPAAPNSAVRSVMLSAPVSPCATTISSEAASIR